MSEQNNQPINDVLTAPTEAPVEQAASPAPIASPASEPVSEESLLLGKFKNSDELAKAYSELEGLLGKRVQDLKPDEAIRLKELQGIPKSSAEYNVPEGVSEELGNWFKEQAAKVGLTKNGALELMSAYQDKLKAENDAFLADFEEQKKQNIEALKKEFGSAYEQRVAMANSAVDKLGGPDLFKVLGEAGLGTNPTIIKAFANLGKLLQEDSIPESKHGTAFGVIPAEAERELSRLRMDPNFAASLVNKNHPDNAKNKAKYAELMAAATATNE